MNLNIYKSTNTDLRRHEFQDYAFKILETSSNNKNYLKKLSCFNI